GTPRPPRARGGAGGGSRPPPRVRPPPPRRRARGGARAAPPPRAPRGAPGPRGAVAGRGGALPRRAPPPPRPARAPLRGAAGGAVEGGGGSRGSRSRLEAGMARIVMVYTPAEFRGHGYAAAVTATATRAALDLGAADVVLFTDLDYPTSNGVYQRIGYRPVL